MDEEEKEIQNKIILARSRLWTPELDKLLRKWKKQIVFQEKGHFSQSRKYNRRHYIFGVPAAVIGSVVATGILSTFQNCDSCGGDISVMCIIGQWFRLVLGILSYFSAALIAFQTFMDYESKAKEHKIASNDFSSLQREIDSILLIPGPYRGSPTIVLQGIRRSFDELMRHSPSLPKKYSTDLTYRVKKWKSIARPPRPDEIRDRYTDVKERIFPLQKILSKNTEGAESDEETASTTKSEHTPVSGETRTSKEKINKVLKNIKLSLSKENEHDTSEEEVCIGFDLDDEPYYNPKEWLNSPRMDSMQQALQFEIERLDRHTHPE